MARKREGKLRRKKVRRKERNEAEAKGTWKWNKKRGRACETKKKKGKKRINQEYPRTVNRKKWNKSQVAENKRKDKSEAGLSVNLNERKGRELKWKKIKGKKIMEQECLWELRKKRNKRKSKKIKGRKDGSRTVCGR